MHSARETRPPRAPVELRGRLGPVLASLAMSRRLVVRLRGFVHRRPCAPPAPSRPGTMKPKSP
eukprot:372265-Pyramimonas_sp.AAC.1